MLFLDEAPQLERATADARVCSLRCVCLVESVGEGGTHTHKVSMMDVDIFRAISDLMSTADDARRKLEIRVREKSYDEFGDIHLILFGDFKTLP